MENHFEPLEKNLLQTWPLERWAEVRVLIAVSGGADSVACLRAFHRLARRPSLLTAAHFNHRWRGDESDDDERFVRQLCESLSLPLVVGQPGDQQDTAARTENSARQSRYEFLTKTAYQIGARYVITAHTASDRIETMLHNLFRGTGISGVSVPTLTRPLDAELVLVRPLLNLFRHEVLEYLEYCQQSFREDSSNEDTSFKRNFLRQNMLPMAREKYGPQVDEHLLNFSQIAEDVQQTLRYYADRWWDEIEAIKQTAIRNGELEPVEGLTIPRLALSSAPWPVVQHGLERQWHQFGWSLQNMSRRHWDSIKFIAQNKHSTTNTTWTATLDLPGPVRMFSLHDWIRFCRA